MCKISIIIPIYNVELYLRECIESTINQTLKDIEIICVDDASTDTSLSIIHEYAKQDDRIKIISYETNKSASQARKDGVLQATGEYIMFLDGDDYLELNACEKLYNLISEKEFDILHFGTNIINTGNASEQRIENLEQLIKPYYGILKEEAVFDGCFIDKKYRFSIWNKIYKNELCKTAFQYVRDGNFPKAQDLYAFFILCYYAKSYYGIEDKLYNYHFGTGITGNANLTIPQLERYCHSVLVAEAIYDFLDKRKEDKYIKVAQDIRKDLLNECVCNWYTAVKDEESDKGFDILCNYWESKEIVSALCEKYYAQRKILAEKVLGAKALQCIPKRDIKTIGIFYHRYALGGVQRVISLLIPMYMEMGYKVVLFTDEISLENEYKLPEEVIRIVLPSSLTIRTDEYVTRAEEFLKHIQKYNIDIMCYQAASSPKLLFDMLLIKLNNIPVIATVHEVAFQSMLTINTEMVNRPPIYKIADRITVLSRVDEMYWRNLGVNATYIPNPLTNRLVQRNPSEIEKNTIVWVGRLDMMTKRCLDVVNIMKYVVQEIPDAKLLVVGNEVSDGIKIAMQKKIEDFKMSENIKLCGYTTDVDFYYRKAEIHLLTSISESFSMTISESKAYGIPLVMYELPFAELCREPGGYLSASQGDMKKIAEHIISILQNEKLKKRLQKGAQDSLIPFLEYDIKKAWKDVFNSLNENFYINETDKTINILLSSLLQHYNYGAIANNNEKNALRRKVAELREQESWRARDYRVGYIILYIPRRLVWGMRKIKNKLMQRWMDAHEN